MGHRLSKIYTRTGDAGDTGLGDGRRVHKDHLRIVCLGDIDELNAHIALLTCCELPEKVSVPLTRVAHELFDMGAELCIPGHSVLTAQHVAHLEYHLDLLNAELPPLAEFILPGGCQSAAQCHVCRTVCRRAERALVALHKVESVAEVTLCYLNRLSDLLFVCARILNKNTATADVLWKREPR